MTNRLGDMVLELLDPEVSQQRRDEIVRVLNEVSDREERYRTMLTPYGGVVANSVETPDGSVRIETGSFQVGNGQKIGEGYSGILLHYPGVILDGEEWHLAGLNDDQLQFGVRASDGVALAGGGVVRLNDDGVEIVGYSIFESSLNSLKFKSDPVVGNFEIGRLMGGTPAATPTGSVSLLSLDSRNNAHNKILVDANGTTSGEVTLRALGGSAEIVEIKLFSQSGSNHVVVNDLGEDVDIRIEGDTDQNLVFVDASVDRVGIGTNTPTDKLDVNSDTMRLRASKTPTSTADISGNTGSIAWDNNYIYVKTGAGWKRAALSTF